MITSTRTRKNDPKYSAVATTVQEAMAYLDPRDLIHPAATVVAAMIATGRLKGELTTGKPLQDLLMVVMRDIAAAKERFVSEDTPPDVSISMV